MGKRTIRAAVDEAIHEEINQIAAREGRTAAEAARLLLVTGLRVYRRKSSLMCGFKGCTRKGCCGRPGVLVPFTVVAAEDAEAGQG